VVAVYNSAGERVRRLFDGAAQVLPGGLALSAEVVTAAGGGLHIGIPGWLWDPGQGLRSGLDWRADNDGDQPVDGGVYTIKAEWTDGFGTVSSWQQPVQVIALQSRNELIIFNSAGEAVARPPLPAPASGRAYNGLALKEISYAPAYDPSSGIALAGFRIELTDETGAVTPVDWDGKNRNGVPVASGLYVAELVYGPSEGGSRHIIETKSFTVLRTGSDSVLDRAVVWPNPVRRGGPLFVRVPLQTAFSVSVRLYGLDGAALAAAADDDGDGWIGLETARLAPGICLLDLEARSAGQVVSRRLRKVAVVR
jgi:hypothetical protein